MKKSNRKLTTAHHGVENQLRESDIYIYIYIYIERERERERVA